MQLQTQEVPQYHFVYQISNLINNKIYVGIHSTNNLKDGYMGSGKYLIRSIKKYGKENFSREILYFCCSFEDAYIIEEEIVDKEFVARTDTYNFQVGGCGHKYKSIIYEANYTDHKK